MRTRISISFSIVILVFMLLFSANGSAQIRVSGVDSFLRIAKEQVIPEKRVETELQAVKFYSAYSVDSCIVLVDSLLATYEKQKNEFGIARAKSLKAWYITYQTRYEESLKLCLEAITLQEKTGADTLGLANSYLRLANVYIHFDKIDESDSYYEKAAALYAALKNDKGLDMVYNNIGAMYSSIDPEKALRQYRKSLALRVQMPDNDYWIAYSYYNIGSAFLHLKQLDSARHYLYLAQKTFIGVPHRTIPSMAILGLASYHYEAAEYAKAELFCKEALEAAKKRNHTEMILEATFLLAESLNKQNKHAEAYAALTDFQELKNDFDSLNNASKVAELELKFNTAKKEKQIAQLEADNSVHESALKQARWITLLVTVTALLFGLIAVFFFIRRQQKQKLHASRLEAGLAEIRLVALRAQMNPHFIFNCINTAQNFVLNADKEAAYDYLANFAKLLRLVLENSGKTFVSLEDEFKQIRLYIELELTRFSEKFSYTISVDPELENGVYEIPSMILQPFIENAILHGLMNKEDATQGRLSVELALKGDSIQCTILDNGVGRLKAQEIKLQKSLHYQSTALPNIEERLSILNRAGQSKISYRIEDIQASGETGTRVIIDLPIK